MSPWKQPWRWEVPDLRSPKRAVQLLETVLDHADRDLIIDLTRVRGVYPNGAVPFAAVLSYLKGAAPRTLTVEIDPSTRLAHIDAAINFDSWSADRDLTLTNSVWCYRSEGEAQRLTNMFMDALTDQVLCDEGVIDAITWCLYEVMDNVFQHSRARAGFVMMQLHQNERRCAIAVADTGIGIQKSLAVGKAAEISILKDPGAAINHSVQQGVTSKGGENQGNGLFGLRRAVEINGGQLWIRSGFGRWSLRDGVVSWATDRKIALPDQEDHQSTLVDWQLDCSKRVRIDEALGGRPYASELLEKIEDDEGIYRVKVEELEESLGSRKLGSDIRRRLENYMLAGARYVVLDFKGVGVISSSFADEVLAKLAASMGELEFRRRVIVEGASTTNRALIETAISLRQSS